MTKQDNYPAPFFDQLNEDKDYMFVQMEFPSGTEQRCYYDFENMALAMKRESKRRAKIDRLCFWRYQLRSHDGSKVEEWSNWRICNPSTYASH